MDSRVRVLYWISSASFKEPVNYQEIDCVNKLQSRSLSVCVYHGVMAFSLSVATR